MANNRARITIIGTGLIGASIGLALKAAKVPYEIVGHDKEHSEATLAKKKGAVDRAEWNLPNSVEGASLIIAAVPVGAIPKLFQDIAPYLAQGAVVTDTASTKREVLTWAAEYLPAHVSFVGGHPMAGRELSGAAAADAAIFHEATWCITPLPRATQESVELVGGLASTCGARPFFIDAEEHDGLVAAISHLPFILSTTLVNAAATSPEWREMGRLAAGGFRDTTRLAGGDPIMYRDICRTNRESILRWMDVFSDELHRMRMLIADEKADLESAFEHAREARIRWQQAYENQDERSGQMADLAPGKQLSQMFLGSGLSKRFGLGGERDERNRDRDTRR